MDRSKLRWLASLITLAIFSLVLPAFPQDPAYHNFAAQQTISNIPNFWNVISNAPFLIVALMAWFDKNRRRDSAANVFILGVFLTALGSAYYHWMPSNERLFWDRLPMTIAFSGVISAIISSRFNQKSGAALLWPVLFFSAASVCYWRWTEAHGHGNLTPYGIVQFGTVALLLGALIFVRRKNSEQRFLWFAAAAYVAAKLLEACDRPIAEALQMMGGHPIKHLAAAVACWYLHRALFSSRPEKDWAGSVSVIQ